MNARRPFGNAPSIERVTEACSWNSMDRANGVQADESPQVYGTHLHNPSQLGLAAGGEGHSHLLCARAAQGVAAGCLRISPPEVLAAHAGGSARNVIGELLGMSAGLAVAGPLRGGELYDKAPLGLPNGKQRFHLGTTTPLRDPGTDPSVPRSQGRPI